MGLRTQRKSAKITEKISKTLGVDFEKVDVTLQSLRIGTLGFSVFELPT